MLARFEILLLKPLRSVIKALSRVISLSTRCSVLGQKKKVSQFDCCAVYYDGL